ncbi:MAG: alcohol dehydrogenase [Planctomycetaceae bacterium]|nr:alcohol dehydrogenase [Planctomycetaceae bacterium]
MTHRTSALHVPLLRPVLIATFVIAAGATTFAGDWPQFRGPARDGKSPEKGLLDQWPAEGPTLLWAVEDLGHGFGSVVVSGKMLYTTGLKGKDGHVFAYDLDGNPLWDKPYGPDWSGSRDGTRATPTIDDGRLYVLSAHGRVACLDAITGDEQWGVDTQKKFGARVLNWGMVESLLIVGDKVICTPGGKKAGMVALDKKTGETVWVCRELTDKSGYCSPILIERGGRQLIVTFTAAALVGVDAANGELLWRHPRKASYDIEAVSPVYENGRIYVTSGYGVGGDMLELAKDGKSVTAKWHDDKLDCQIGGVILHKGHVYGASDKSSGGDWICLNLKTGEVAAETRAVGKGSITYADGMFYGYGENGQIGLIKASPKDFGLVSSFKVPKGKRQNWAHPTVANGRLYIRHGSALMAFDIRSKSWKPATTRPADDATE